MDDSLVLPVLERLRDRSLITGRGQGATRRGGRGGKLSLTFTPRKKERGFSFSHGEEGWAQKCLR